MITKKFIVLLIIFINILIILGGLEYYNYIKKTIENDAVIPSIILSLLAVYIIFGIMWLYHFFREQTEERLRHELINVRLNLLEFAENHPLDELLTKTLDEVERLTGSKIGFYHIVEDDQETLILQAWSTSTMKEFCKAEGKGLHYSISKAGVWVDCIYEKAPVIHNNYQYLKHKKGMPEGHADVLRELVVPILREGKIVAILGVGNKRTDYTQKDIEIVSYLADIAWEIVRKKSINERIGYLAKRYETMISHLHAGTIIVDEFDRVEFINNSFTAIFDLKNYDNTLIGLNIEEFLLVILPNFLDPQKIFTMMKGFLHNNINYTNHEIELIDGRVLLTDFISINIEGRNHGKICLYRDITENKIAENEIIHQNSIFNAIINNSHSIMIFMVNNDFRYIKFNENYLHEMQKNYGKAPQIGMNILDYINILEDSELMKNTLERVFSGDSFTEIKHQPRLDKYYEFHWNQVRKHNDEIYAASCFIFDVTQRIKITKRIEYLNSILAAIRNINQLIVKESDKQWLIQKTCNLLIDTRGFRHTIIILVDEKQKTTSYAFASEDKNQLKLLSSVFEAGILFSCQKKALEEKKLVVIEDIDKDCPECPFESNGENTGVLVVPLIYGNKVFGIFSIYLEKHYINAPEEQSLFLEVAGDIAYALHKLELEDEKKNAMEALKESERRYSDLYEKSPDMHLSVDPESLRIIQCNETLSKITGYSKEELYSKTLTELYHPRCLEGLRKNMEQFRNTGKIENAEMEVVKKNGESIYVLIRSSAVYNNEGRITHSRSVWRDVTIQKKLETEEKRLWKILKESLNEIYIFSKDTLQFEFVNDGALRNLGYSLEEIRNLTPVDIKPEYDISTFQAAILPLLMHEKNILIFETLHKRKDGTLYNVDVHLQLMKYGTGEIFVAIMQDITDRKKAEAEIRESEHFIKTVMDNLPIGIAVNSADPTVNFQYINDNFTKFYDVTREALAVQDNFWYEVYEDAEFREEMKKRVLDDCASGDPAKMIWESIPIKRTGKQTRYITARNIPLSANRLMVSLVWDVTERKIAESALEESKNKLQSIFSAAPIGIGLVNDRVLLEVNGAFFRMLGYTPEELIGKSSRILYPDDEEFEQVGKKVFRQMNENGKVNIETKWLRKDGRIINILLGSVLTDLNGYEGFNVFTALDITERKRSEEKIAESQALLNTIINSTNDLVFTVDPHDFGLITFNEALVKNFLFLGIELKVGMKPDDLLPEGRAKLWKEFYNKTLRNGTFITEYKSSASGVELLLSFNLIKRNDEVFGISVFGKDITEIKENENRIQQLADDLQKAQQVSHVGSWKWYIQTNKLEWSDEMYRIFGIDKNSFTGNLADIIFRSIHPDDRFAVEASNLSVIKDGQPVPLEYRIILRDNSIRTVWAEAGELVYDDENLPYLLTGIVQDITEQRKAEKALRESKEMYSKLIANVPDVIVRTDIEGKIIFTSESVRQWNSINSQRFLNEKLFTFVSDNDKERAISNFKKILSEGVGLQEYHLNIDGEEMDCEVNGDVLLDSNGVPYEMVFVIRNITDRKIIERELEVYRLHLEKLVKDRTSALVEVNKQLADEIVKVKEADEKIKAMFEKEKELSKLKSKFISITSHEFRTPLTTLLSSFEILEMGGKNYSESKKKAHYLKIRRNIEYLTNMIDELLYLNRIESNKIEVSLMNTNILDFCKEILEEIKYSYPSIELSVNLELEKQEFKIDRTILKKILGNLLTNAFKYNKENGIVSFTIYTENNKLHIKIMDTGIGFPAEEQNSVFEPFTRMSNSRHIKGTGLGLSIVKRSVEQLNGEISFTSILNKGTEFTVKIPV